MSKQDAMAPITLYSIEYIVLAKSELPLSIKNRPNGS